jgi:hypothetical protein
MVKSTEEHYFRASSVLSTSFETIDADLVVQRRIRIYQVCTVLAFISNVIFIMLQFVKLISNQGVRHLWIALSLIPSTATSVHHLWVSQKHCDKHMNSMTCW